MVISDALKLNKICQFNVTFFPFSVIHNQVKEEERKKHRVAFLSCLRVSIYILTGLGINVSFRFRSVLFFERSYDFIATIADKILFVKEADNVRKDQ